ncbi:MAG: hypothetical protein A2521_03610 [Deltaproteobacteria bacterium RIFOXYD12_FULL_57_12]|nr:MAG: hypothetical protein A2521_03610 [Deltaproteobacteria bacterium RIFOXYD12_FULL_57_12]
MESTLKERVSLVLVGAAYLVFNLRYAAGRLVDSLTATGVQLLTTAPYVIGLTVVVISFLQRAAGRRLPLDRVLRIYFTLGIIIGFFHALSDHLAGH